MTRLIGSRGLMLCCALLLMPFAIAPPAACAAESTNPDFEVTVQDGDTLSGLGKRWLADPRRWPDVQRHNRIADPNRLVPGSRLAIPAALLRESPHEVTVSNVSGQARRADGTPIASGDRLREGTTVKTAEDGYVTIKLVDGSTLRLQSQSDLAIERARRVPGTEATEARFRMHSGQVEVQFKPDTARASRFEIRTGFASAAVRGTEFRVAAGAKGTRTEVTRGTIAFAGLPPDSGAAAATDSVAVPEGFGSLVDESRKPVEPVRLLAAPALPKEPVFQKAPALRLAFPPLEGAVSYRIRLAADAEFQRMVAEVVQPQPEANFSGLKMGAYALSVRGIDTLGLEGRDAIALIGITPPE